MILQTRNDLPKLLNELHLVGTGAEIGVYTGQFSAHILREWKGKCLYSIDPWMHQSRKMDVSDVQQDEQDKLLSRSVATLQPFKSRSHIMREFSVQAARSFYKHQLDFVYIDACHDYRSVWADINAWYPIVKPHGVIAGHDYKDSFVRKNLVEVKRAVDNFFVRLRLYFPPPKITFHRGMSSKEPNVFRQAQRQTRVSTRRFSA
jgi:hypothetical protein